MKCPYCLVEINPSFTEQYLGAEGNEHWASFNMVCPNEACSKRLVMLGMSQLRQSVPGPTGGSRSILKDPSKFWVKPLGSTRPPVPVEVDDACVAADYTEACLVLAISTKASAALSRRCLQYVLREKGGVKKGDLANEIQQVLDSKQLPSYLAESIDAVRNVGNFAAHPLKSTSTGAIVEVEPGEAEWLLDVLEALFDFYYVQPALLAAKRASLNQKLAGIGKPPLK